jgi:hypothetical protein
VAAGAVESHLESALEQSAPPCTVEKEQRPPEPAPSTDAMEVHVPPRPRRAFPFVFVAAAACGAIVVTAMVRRTHATPQVATAASLPAMMHDETSIPAPPPPAEDPPTLSAEDLPRAASAESKKSFEPTSVAKLAHSEARPAAEMALPPPAPEPEPPPPPPEPKAAPPKVVVEEQIQPESSGGAAGRGFDVVAAHGALDAVQPSSCWARGTARGYGRARVTFGASGGVQMVEIASPVQGASPDTDCVARMYASATVPPFHGASVTAYTTFFVK